MRMAVFAVLLCTWLGVQLIVINKQIDWRDVGDPQNVAGDMQLWANYCTDRLLPNPEEGRPGRLKTELATLKEEVGVASTSFPQPLSALHGFLLVMETIYAQENQVGRIGIRHVSADYQAAKKGRTESRDAVEVELDLDFFDGDSSSGSQNLGRLQAALRAQPWFLEHPEPQTNAFDGGIAVDGFKVTVDVVRALEEEEPTT